MLSVIECYSKVYKECFKFIRSQETSKDKFKNKEKMIKSFLIPISFWISNKVNKKRPYIVGLSGGQGTGKTTISTIIEIILKKYFKLNVFKISIDDFYKTRSARLSLSKKIHPLLMTRGVPGTHEINLLLKFLNKIKGKKFKAFKIPRFDKSIDDRFKKKFWHTVKEKPDVIIFEGWCIGSKPEKNNTLKKAVNFLEKTKDQKLIWRKFVNHQIKNKYNNLNRHLDCLFFLKAKNFSTLQKWRFKQERKLFLKNKNRKKSKYRIMNKKEVINFMHTYQRISQNMFKNVPKYASLVLNLNSNHQIKSAIYK